MESRVSYAAVGLFVVLLSAALVAVGLWLGSGITAKRYDRYSIYFEESVSGLTRNAPVKYRGVVVGRVERIELAEHDPERVHLVIAVEEHTPIKTDTTAKLDPQGVTGLVHVELTGGTREAPPLESAGGAPYPVIPSEPSLISRLDQALSRGLGTVDRVAERLLAVLSEENQQNLSETLANLERFSAALAANADRLEAALRNAEAMTERGAAAAAELPQVMAQARQTLAEFETLAQGLQSTSAEFRAMAAAGTREIDQLGSRTLPEVDALLLELRTLTESLTLLTEDLRSNPRMLLFGRPQPAPGPGER